MMETLKDYLYTMESCNSCGQCRFVLGPKSKGWDYAEVCPIYSRYLFDSYSGQGLINIAQELLEGTLEYDDNLIKHIYSCTTCGACDVNCKSVRDMEVMDTILALRAKCVADGRGPMPEHKQRAQLIKENHNFYGKNHGNRFDWLPEGVKQQPTAEIAYFVGCSSAYLYPDIARNTIRILQAGNINFKLLDSREYCCGAPLWRTGQIVEASVLAEHNLEVLKQLKIKTLIVSCAECYGTFKGFYPRISELNFEVLHISEVISRLLQEGRLKFNKQLPMKITYHDPCLLGRLSELYIPWKGEIRAYGYHDPPKQFRRGTDGIYDIPRQILKAIPGIELVEMPRNAENAFCCGGGGGVPDAFPDFSQWIANQRIAEAVSTEAESIVSGCPFCQSSFQKAISGIKNRLHYYDITELVAKAI
jgi:Fe-S oxidoreductase